MRETPALEPGTLALAVGDQPLHEAENLLAGPLPARFDARDRHIILLDAPMTPALREHLEQHGVVLGEYLPAYAWHAMLADVAPAALAAHPRVLGVIRYEPAWKVSPTVGTRTFASAERTQMAGNGRAVLDITFFGDVTAAEAIDIISGLDADARIHRVSHVAGHEVLTVELDLFAVPIVADSTAVQFIEESPDITLRNETTRWIVQSDTTGHTPLYDHGLTGAGQIIGIMDGRMNPEHCSFFDTEPIGSTHRKILAYNTTPGNSTHGTHVSGTAVGDAGDTSDTRGVAFHAHMVFNSIPSYTETAMYDRLALHHAQGARVHTNSWGDDNTTEYNGLCRGIDAFQYDFEDSLVLFAVTNRSTLRNPENAKNLVAVGASEDAPNQDEFCSGGEGPTSDGRRKPELFAPGCDTQSSVGGSCNTTALTGTSMACPAIAGMAALVRQYFVDGFCPTGQPRSQDGFEPTAALLKAMLLNAAVDMTGINGYPSNGEGWGRLLADNAAHFTGEARTLYLEDRRNADGLTTGEMIEHLITVGDAAESLRITLAFTDPPATAGAGFAAVNDLDLEVIAPGGAVYRGNVFAGGESTEGGAFDDRNNVEQVSRLQPQPGVWVVRIHAAAVNVGTQGYALVATGDIAPDAPPAMTLTEYRIDYGSYESGDLNDARTSDDTYLRIRSQFGFAATAPNLNQVTFRLDATGAPFENFDAAIESRINNPGGVAIVRMKNYRNNGEFEEIGQYPLSTTDATKLFTALPAADYISDDNRRARLEIRHIVVSVFSAGGFVSSYDRVELQPN